MTAVTQTAHTRAISFDFYTWMAVAFLATAFLGFIPTYWLPMARGSVSPQPIVHIHAFLFFSWTIFVIVQSALVPSHRVRLHRSVGLAGIALGTLLTVVGLLASITLLRDEMAHGLASAGESFLVVPLVNIATFAVFFWLAIANTRRPDYHKRYMLLAAISVLLAPLARPLIVWVLPPPPPHTGVSPSIYLSAAWLSYLFIVVAMIYDWRRQGRPHRVYLIALPVLIIISLLVVPISHMAAWHEFARGFAALAGPLPAKAG